MHTRNRFGISVFGVSVFGVSVLSSVHITKTMIIKKKEL